MEEGASAPLELSRGGSQPKVSPRSSPGGSYPTPLALSSSLPLRPYASRKETACCLLAPTRKVFQLVGPVLFFPRKNLKKS